MPTFTYYNIVVFGEPSVGKTCFIDQFCHGRSFVAYDLDDSGISHGITVNDQVSNLKLIDLSTSFLKPETSAHPTEWAKKILADADGIVLLYDITDAASMEYLTFQAYNYLWACRGSGIEGETVCGRAEHETFGCVLVGNKQDLVDTHKKTRAVSPSLASEWAQTQGIRSIEIDSLTKVGPQSALELLVLNVRKLERLGLSRARDGQKHQETKSREENKNLIRTALRKGFQSRRG